MCDNKTIEEKLDKLIKGQFEVIGKRGGVHKIIQRGKSRGEDAIVHEIANKEGKTYRKRVKISDILKAYNYYREKKELTRDWAKENIPECLKDGGCNFVVIRGLVEKIYNMSL